MAGMSCSCSGGMKHTKSKKGMTHHKTTVKAHAHSHPTHAKCSCKKTTAKKA